MAEVTPCDFQNSVMRNLVASAYTNRHILSWNSLSLEESSDCVRTATNHETTCRGRERERHAGQTSAVLATPVWH